ncbi:conserved protein, unknown function [Hepatocystis sp. ex Piliocolobus tephrosceles]|nr:conserved protein, unknown function [Hepatocystis sp. ex Piliocolobus tephrosceles]
MINFLKNVLLIHLLIGLQLYNVSTGSVKKNDMNLMNFLPSNSIVYPLDFQENWQASEPIKLNIHYDIPSYGYKDLLMTLEYHNDLETFENELEEIKRRTIYEQNRLEENLWNKILKIKSKTKQFQHQKFLRSQIDHN